MGMPWNISKGTILENVDQVCNDPEQRSAFLAALKDCAQESLLDIWKNAGILPGNWHVSHMQNHWFHPAGWWNDVIDPQGNCVQPLETVFRQGLIKAIELATARNLPVDCYWVCSGYYHFEVEVCVSAHQVTFILLSPQVPAEGRHDKANTSLTYKEPIWVVRRMKPADADEALARSQKAGTEAKICVDEKTSRIVVEQLRNFPAHLPQSQLPPPEAPYDDLKFGQPPASLGDS